MDKRTKKRVSLEVERADDDDGDGVGRSWESKPGPLTLCKRRCQSLFSAKSRALVFLCVGMLSYAIQNSLFARLTVEGNRTLVAMNLTGEELAQARNPISSSDVLFIGNIFATVTNAVVFRKSLFNKSLVKAVTRRQWAGLFFVTLLYTVGAKSLDFEAVEAAKEADCFVIIVLVFRLEPVNTLLLTRLIYKEHQSIHAYLQSLLVVTGLVLAIFLIPRLMGDAAPPLSLKPLLLAFGSTCTTALSNTLARKVIQQVPLGIFFFFRTSVGAICFFFLVWVRQGYPYGLRLNPRFLGFTVSYMLLFGGVVMVIGNGCWYSGVKTAPPAIISLVGSAYLIFSLLFAYIVAGDTPSLPAYVGAGVILSAIAYAQFIALRKGGTLEQSTKTRPRGRTMRSGREASSELQEALIGPNSIDGLAGWGVGKRRADANADQWSIWDWADSKEQAKHNNVIANAWNVDGFEAASHLGGI
eukprot:g3532.t1